MLMPKLYRTSTEKGGERLDFKNVSPRAEGDLLVFDVDGVLIDTRFSYPSVIRAAIQWGWRRMLGRDTDCTGFSMRHFRISKRHPGFNDDYDIAWALLAVAAASSRLSGDERLSRAMPSPEEWGSLLETFPAAGIVEHTIARFGDPVGRDRFRRLCEEMYLGEHFDSAERLTKAKRGLWHAEKPLLGCHWKDLVLPVAIYTGRFLPELGLALARLGWEDFPKDRVVTPETGISKPSGEGFARLCRATGTHTPIYFGDTESDRESLRRFGRGTFVAVGGLLPEELFRYDGVAEALQDLGFLAALFNDGCGRIEYA
jgi:phosphoglycolate phosphatase-like HAD superfamily hydrolase